MIRTINLFLIFFFLLTNRLFSIPGDLLQTYLKPASGVNGASKNLSATVDYLFIGEANAENSSGVVYQFDIDTGTLLHTFLNPTPEENDFFGTAVVAEKNRVLISASGDNTGAKSAGAAYLFDIDTGALLHTFLNPNPEENDFFGLRVELAGNNVFISGLGEVCYRFDTENSALLQAYLQPVSDTSRQFGGDIWSSEEYVVINEVGLISGVVHIFNKETGVLLHTILNPNPPERGDFFGVSFSIINNNILIGAPGENIGSPSAGIVYLFDIVTGSLLKTFLNPNPEEGNSFGSAIEIIENGVFIGAPGAGIVYLFDIVTGSLLQSFLNPIPEDGDTFGIALEAVGNNILIGERNAKEVYLFESVIKQNPMETTIFDKIKNSTSEYLSLTQNHPNPFNGSTIISFALPQTEMVELAIYNIAGQKVSILVSGEHLFGDYRVYWNGYDNQKKALASGIYFYRLQTKTQSLTKKLHLIR